MQQCSLIIRDESFHKKTHRDVFDSTLKNLRNKSGTDKNCLNTQNSHGFNRYFFRFERLQLLIRISCATIMNKSQGQTLKFARVDLQQPFFLHECSRIDRSNYPYIY